MNVFLSSVSTEFQSYRLRLANQLGALKGHPYEIKVQEDFQQGGFTLLDQLAAYIRDCDLVIHLAGDACGARPTPEHVLALYRSLGDTPPDPLPDRSYTQWEYHLAQRFQRKMLVYLAAPDAPRNCKLPVAQDADAARMQQAHIAAIKQSGKHRAAFSRFHLLLKEVFHDLDLEDDRRINNLPLPSLGSIFKGRDNVLKEINKRFGSIEYRGYERVPVISSLATAVAVHGLGGSGKTRVALEYAHRYIDEYTALLFVIADSKGGLQQNVAALCGETVLDLPEKTEREIDVQVAAVLQWLQQHAGWLLIFDNVDTDEAARAVSGLLGRLTPSGEVLVTSRLSNWEGAVKTLSLDVLTAADATEFLLERTQSGRRIANDDPAQARTVAVKLGNLPLALEQAGAYIGYYTCTFAEYLVSWRDEHKKVLEWFDERLMQYPRSVAATWQTSFKRLEKRAQQLLRILSWLAPDPIPVSLLEAGGGPFARLAGKKTRITPDAREALAQLHEHSLVTRAHDAPTFSVHRLVQDVTRSRSNRTSKLGDLKAALRWVDAAFAGDPEDVRNWPVLLPLATHALTLTRHADAAQISEPPIRLLSQLGMLYYARAQYAEAEPLMLQAIKMSEPYGREHPVVATLINNLATLFKETKRAQAAEPLYRRALEIDEKANGLEHSSVARDLNNLAALLQGTNRSADAEPLMRRALAIDEKSYGSDHPDVARDLNNLAQLLQDTNRLADAELLMVRQLKILVKFERDNRREHSHFQTAISNHFALLKQMGYSDQDAFVLLNLILRKIAAEYGVRPPNFSLAQ
jgi:tetratricopeptide (TPR) repeat protein